MLYPYPGCLWYERPELTEVPATGMNVGRTELTEVPGTGMNRTYRSSLQGKIPGEKTPGMVLYVPYRTQP